MGASPQTPVARFARGWGRYNWSDGPLLFECYRSFFREEGRSLAVYFMLWLSRTPTDSIPASLLLIPTPVYIFHRLRIHQSIRYLNSSSHRRTARPPTSHSKPISSGRNLLRHPPLPLIACLRRPLGPRRRLPCMSATPAFVCRILDPRVRWPRRRGLWVTT